MKQLAVIGYPISHSLSPALHGAALAACGVDAGYDRREVAPADLPAFVSDLRSGDWLGINVTVPHKEAVIPLLDGLSPEAEAIGAVNTVVVSQERLVGYNTDGIGFLQALRERGRFDPRGRQVVVLGAGGAARAVVWALCRAGAARVSLHNRHRERAQRLAASARAWQWDTEVAVEPWDPAAVAMGLAGAGLLVNATSVGLAVHETPLPAELIPEGILAVDLIYNPRPTRLLREAALRGARTLDGLPMLVYQGAAAFELWTGHKAPVEAMQDAAERALVESHQPPAVSHRHPHPVDLPSGRSTPLPEGEGRRLDDA
ncbi:MAG: shikimate dehydrogenase [Actinobacteria bacterium]|nr:shikimate dehydrogenase [Actinomycetota bacterium]